MPLKHLLMLFLFQPISSNSCELEQTLSCTTKTMISLRSTRLATILTRPQIRKQCSTAAANMTDSTTIQHYTSHDAESYESAYFYEPGAYTKHLCTLVQDRLQLTTSNSQRVLLDIGGGTGNFTKMIVQDTPVQAIVVDPFLESSNSDASAESSNVSFIKAPAEDFIRHKPDWSGPFDQVLMKEVVHHLAEKDRVPIFQGIWEGLNASNGPPSILIITRPKHDIDYPLWKEARLVWAEHQPSIEEFRNELAEAKFVDIQHTLEAYPCSIALDRWLSMIKARFWSTFANFADDELELACAKIVEDEKHRVDAQGKIHFEDRLLFISAKKVR